MRYLGILVLCLILSGIAYAQVSEKKSIMGSVHGLTFHATHQDTLPLIGANVFWLDTPIGTVSDQDGIFRLQIPTELESKKLVVSYVGFENDTLDVQTSQSVKIILNELLSTKNVVVQAEKPHTHRVQDTAINSRTITETGLQTLACCSLAESFENTVDVDVEQTDAISGARRIKMLGLAGFYTQVLVEKKPVMRGLVSPFALEYVPGFWMDSIDISKGTSSVATGYESITGQINVELKKPETAEPIRFNAYQNSMGKTEAALTLATELNPHLSTMLLTYGAFNQRKIDNNADTFLDMPLIQHINIMNRWKYDGPDKKAQLGIKIINDHRDGGQHSFDFERDRLSTDFYGSHSRTERYELYAKFGMSFDEKSSVGVIFSGFQHEMDSFWGLKSYSGNESSLYANLLYQYQIDRHKVAAGLSYTFDDRNEFYQNELYNSDERVPGAFVEYTYQIEDRLTALAGFRYDDHNLFGAFYTPRFHLKYQLDESALARFSVGKGYRNPHVFTENPAILAGSRGVAFVEELQAEEAWNTGIQFVKDFSLGYDRPATLALDFYRTEFVNQIIVDMEQNAHHIYLYNLDGQSYSNSAQVELETTLAKGFVTTAAFRYNDVKATYNGLLKQVPLNNTYKGLLVLSYTLPNDHWQFDWTTQVNGQSRLPDLKNNPENYKVASYSPAHAVMFAQVKRKFDRWEMYVGIENLTDYRQNNPILAWDEPFSPYFDSSLIWGPVVGRRVYVGIRVN